MPTNIFAVLAPGVDHSSCTDHAKSPTCNPLPSTVEYTMSLIVK